LPNFALTTGPRKSILGALFPTVPIQRINLTIHLLGFRMGRSFPKLARL
jgi:hypothetical protein